MRDYIEDYEELFRAVTESVSELIVDGIVSPAFFIDEGGLSVDRKGDRTPEQVVASLERRFRKYNPCKNAVVLTARQCRDADTYPIAKPTNNQYHAEIHDSKDIIEISTLKAMQLADFCKIICV